MCNLSIKGREFEKLDEQSLRPTLPKPIPICAIQSEALRIFFIYFIAIYLLYLSLSVVFAVTQEIS